MYVCMYVCMYVRNMDPKLYFNAAANLLYELFAEA